MAFDFRTANMGMPALKLDQENTVEESIGEIKERLVRVETTVEHIQDGVSELKADVRHLDQKIDAVEQKIETVEHRLLSKFDVVVQAIADLRVGQKNERVWYLLQLLGLLGVLAKAFKWI
jgi:predicted nuclease with TOPRIM domain